MRRTFIVSLLFLVFATACQTYTSSLQKSLVRANETTALATLRAIALAERTFSISNDGEYGTLKQLVDAGLLDSRFANEKPLKDYVITLTVTPKAEGSPEGSYTCNADPERNGDRVGRHFYIDSISTGIHVNDTQPASAADKLTEQQP